MNVVDLSLDLLPSYVTGTLGGPHPTQQDLAVAVNGTIEAVTRSYTEFGETKFARDGPRAVAPRGRERGQRVRGRAGACSRSCPAAT